MGVLTKKTEVKNTKEKKLWIEGGSMMEEREERRGHRSSTEMDTIAEDREEVGSRLKNGGGRERYLVVLPFLPLLPLSLPRFLAFFPFPFLRAFDRRRSSAIRIERRFKLNVID